MFLEFFDLIFSYFTPFRVVGYLTFRSAFAALTRLLICFVFGGRIIEFLRRLKIGQSVREDGPQTHLLKSGTPTMGGIFIIFSVVVSMLLWGNYHNRAIMDNNGRFHRVCRTIFYKRAF